MKRATRHTVAIPRREFLNGDVHYAGPFKSRDGVHLTLCGLDGVEKVQGRVRGGLTCQACDSLARWVWSHRRAYGFGQARPGDQLVDPQTLTVAKPRRWTPPAVRGRPRKEKAQCSST